MACNHDLAGGHVNEGLVTSTAGGHVTCRGVQAFHGMDQGGAAQLAGWQQPLLSGEELAEGELGQGEPGIGQDGGYRLPEGDVLCPFAAGQRVVLPTAVRQPAQAPGLEEALAASRASLTRQQWEECQQFAARSPQLMKEALARLEKFQTHEGQWQGTQQEFMQLVQQYLVPHWRVGNTYHHREAWEVALAPRLGTGNAAEVLQIVRNGIGLHLVQPYSQADKPNFAAKERAVQDMLGGDSPAVQGVLHAQHLPPVYMGNLARLWRQRMRIS